VKEVMDGYVGVKFEAIQLAPHVPMRVRGLRTTFKEGALRLREFEMTPKNAGNMSMRIHHGVAITSSGSNLGRLEDDEVVYVQRCSIEGWTVAYMGSKEPSSETPMHYLIYESRPDAGAIVHAHDPATSGIQLRDIRETAREEPYGTLALAKIACETFRRDENIIVLKNHGYVAIGDTLKGAIDLVVATHLRLVAQQSL
jgi:ribulose-5-phosphate 4-epimerase/fuculose-1-phosphate aldolase